MASFATVRDPLTDYLLTPQNATLAIIDFQPVQVASIRSRRKRELVANITAIGAMRSSCRRRVVDDDLQMTPQPSCVATRYPTTSRSTKR